mmetsp:Transcript_30076/g.80458  ORF Transcript_30076/g.80458 Transcript_30076/m.80458 type:complete len:624 (+) Transcript_30076:214-2085(+)
MVGVAEVPEGAGGARRGRRSRRGGGRRPAAGVQGCRAAEEWGQRRLRAALGEGAGGTGGGPAEEAGRHAGEPRGARLLRLGAHGVPEPPVVRGLHVAARHLRRGLRRRQAEREPLQRHARPALQAVVRCGGRADALDRGRRGPGAAGDVHAAEPGDPAVLRMLRAAAAGLPPSPHLQGGSLDHRPELGHLRGGGHEADLRQTRTKVRALVRGAGGPGEDALRSGAPRRREAGGGAEHQVELRPPGGADRAGVLLFRTLRVPAAPPALLVELEKGGLPEGWREPGRLRGSREGAHEVVRYVGGEDAVRARRARGRGLRGRAGRAGEVRLSCQRAHRRRGLRGGGCRGGRGAQRRGGAHARRDGGGAPGGARRAGVLRIHAAGLPPEQPVPEGVYHQVGARRLRRETHGRGDRQGCLRRSREVPLRPVVRDAVRGDGLRRRRGRGLGDARRALGARDWRAKREQAGADELQAHARPRGARNRRREGAEGAGRGGGAHARGPRDRRREGADGGGRGGGAAPPGRVGPEGGGREAGPGGGGHEGQREGSAVRRAAARPDRGGERRHRAGGGARGDHCQARVQRGAVLRERGEEPPLARRRLPRASRVLHAHALWLPEPGHDGGAVAA